MKNETILERLHNDLGRPAWFWPAVLLVLFVVLPLAASYVENAP